MAYARPSLTEIIERKIADLDSRLPTASARLRRSVLNALLRASAAVEHGLYGYINYLSRQVVPNTAEVEFLERHANWWDVARVAASAATGSVTVTGSGTVPAGTVLQRADGTEYMVDSEVVISSSGSVDVTCSTPGANGNASSDTSLSFVSPIAGIDSTATAGDLTGGADIETDDALRARLRERVQQPPHGGALHDYIAWSKEVAGVTRVWPKDNWLGAGTVGVFFVRDNDVSIIPDSAEVQTVQDHIDTKRPVGMKGMTVIAPIEASQDMTISISPNDSTTQAAIEAELSDLFSRESNVEDGNGSGTILISHIREAVSIAAGENDHAMVSPTADITLSIGEIATLGTITFQSL
jgi:uncharacterized phage protein gp47/JayE